MSKYYATENSFGEDLPNDWERHARMINKMLDAMNIAEDSTACNEFWGLYWSDNWKDCMAFVAGIYLSATEGRYPMTVEEAACNLREWQEEGVEDIPRSLTPELLSALWNEFLDDERPDL